MARRRRPSEAPDQALSLARGRIYAACAFVNGPVDGVPAPLNAALEDTEGGFAVTAALAELDWCDLVVAADAIDSRLGGKPGLPGYLRRLRDGSAQELSGSSRI